MLASPLWGLEEWRSGKTERGRWVSHTQPQGCQRDQAAAVPANCTDGLKQLLEAADSQATEDRIPRAPPGVSVSAPNCPQSMMASPCSLPKLTWVLLIWEPGTYQESSSGKCHCRLLPFCRGEWKKTVPGRQCLSRQRALGTLHPFVKSSSIHFLPFLWPIFKWASILNNITSCQVCCPSYHWRCAHFPPTMRDTKSHKSPNPTQVLFIPHLVWLWPSVDKL